MACGYIAGRRTTCSGISTFAARITSGTSASISTRNFRETQTTLALGEAIARGSAGKIPTSIHPPTDHSAGWRLCGCACEPKAGRAASGLPTAPATSTGQPDACRQTLQEPISTTTRSAADLTLPYGRLFGPGLGQTFLEFGEKHFPFPGGKRPAARRRRVGLHELVKGQPELLGGRCAGRAVRIDGYGFISGGGG